MNRCAFRSAVLSFTHVCARRRLDPRQAVLTGDPHAALAKVSETAAFLNALSSTGAAPAGDNNTPVNDTPQPPTRRALLDSSTATAAAPAPTPGTGRGTAAAAASAAATSRKAHRAALLAVVSDAARLMTRPTEFGLEVSSVRSAVAVCSAAVQNTAKPSSSLSELEVHKLIRVMHARAHDLVSLPHSARSTHTTNVIATPCACLGARWWRDTHPAAASPPRRAGACFFCARGGSIPVRNSHHVSDPCVGLT
jgi:hypothetical protein